MARRIMTGLSPIVALIGGCFSVWVFVVLVFLLCSGCVQNSGPDDPLPPPSPKPKPVIVEPEPLPEPITLSVTAADSLLSTLHETLGDSGSITINPESAIVIRRPQATLTIKPGTKLSYDLTNSGGSISFSNPRPSVSASVWGIKVTPQLARLDLKPDNTGTAHVEAGPLKLSRQFSLGWLESAGNTAATEELPVVRIYSADWCGPCQQAKRELFAAPDLPFRVVVINENTAEFPSWVTGLPTFHWQAGDGWRQRTGWSDLPSFLATWRASTAADATP